METLTLAEELKKYRQKLGFGKDKRRYDRHKKPVLVPKAFNSLSRYKRRDAVVRLKSKMRQKQHLYGGRFLTDVLMNEPGRPELYDQNFKFKFPGTDGVTIWNAYVETAQYAFWQEARKLAGERTNDRLSEQERFDRHGRFEPNFSPGGKVTSYRWVSPEEKTYEQFDGLTYDEYERKMEDKIILNEPPTIFEYFRIDKDDYAYGTGLLIVIDAHTINRQIIETTIDRFIALGEKDWQAEIPVNRDKLPFERYLAALKKINTPYTRGEENE